MLIPYICTTCGVQYEPAPVPPAHCIICEDDRQYVNPHGQQWTTLPDLRKGHRNRVEAVAGDLYAIYTEPGFGINQRAHLLRTPGGNILWDCIALLDEETIAAIRELGGLRAIALSHPHYFSTIVEWSRAFDVPVYVNALDSHWLTRSSDSIKLWREERLDLWETLTLVRCGGHFPGACVLHSPQHGGLLLVGDTIQVSPNLKTVSFMYSYPNLIPLAKNGVLQIRDSLRGLSYHAMYGAFGKYITINAMDAMEASVERYLKIFE